MNEKTRASVKMYVGYWRDFVEESSPVRAEALEQAERLAVAELPLDDQQLEAFFADLDVEVGACGGGFDKTISERILREKYGLDDEQARLMLECFEVLGGHCDCEVLLNAKDRMLW